MLGIKADLAECKTSTLPFVQWFWCPSFFLIMTVIICLYIVYNSLSCLWRNQTVERDYMTKLFGPLLYEPLFIVSSALNKIRTSNRLKAIEIRWASKFLIVLYFLMYVSTFYKKCKKFSLQEEENFLVGLYGVSKWLLGWGPRVITGDFLGEEIHICIYAVAVFMWVNFTVRENGNRNSYMAGTC